jgi:hypothetical protein
MIGETEMAIVYQCVYRDRQLTTGCATFDQGKRERCKGCKSTVREVHGHAILTQWRGDDRYTLDGAVKEFSTYAAAERAAMKAYEADNRSELVARFIL